MFVQWTAQKLNPLGRSPWRGQISYRAVLVKSEWVGGKTRKTNRYLATIRFKPDRETGGGGQFINADGFLDKCRCKLKELSVSDADQQKILLDVQKYLDEISGPPKCLRMHNAAISPCRASFRLPR